MTSLPQILTE